MLMRAKLRIAILTIVTLGIGGLVLTGDIYTALLILPLVILWFCLDSQLRYVTIPSSWLTRKYTILRNPHTGAIKAVAEGFSFWLFLLNGIQLGWIWAFARGGFEFAWRLLAVTALATLAIFYAANNYGNNDPVALVLLLVYFSWLGFSIWVGHNGNDRLKSSLVHRGFVTVASDVDSTTADEAIERAIKLRNLAKDDVKTEPRIY
jgi:hypothetical protein